MQAIARVNRVFKNKPGGLVVDYIGIAQSLKNALAAYSSNDRKNAGIDQAEAVAVMLEKYEIVKDMFFGFDYSAGLQGGPKGRLVVMAGGNGMDTGITAQSGRKRKFHRGQKTGA